ncbi:hypothetical protein IWQ56_003059 [Coemansia nantahalensis]|nr:hypothetical protein IWQ56_003059 [Coemansia nantahalensis]
MPRDSAEATNSLVVLLDSFSDTACDEARARLAACGRLEHFARLPSFARCLAVFGSTADAQAARSALHGICLDGGNRLRLYHVQHAPVDPHPHLDVPHHDKLWLISPPGSPPVDWRPTREDPPNAAHLDRQLVSALRELGHGRFALDLADVSDGDSASLPDADVEPLDLGLSADHFAISAGGVDADSSDDSDAGGSGTQRAPAIIIQDCNHGDNSQPETMAASARLCMAPATYRPTRRPPGAGFM